MRNKIYTKALFAVYSLLLVWVVLLKLEFDILAIEKTRALNLMPFYYEDVVEGDFPIFEALANLLVFLPFGIYLKILNCKNKKIILSGFLLSLVFETVQFVFELGKTDITDLITNTLGVIVGVLIYELLFKACKRKEVLNKTLLILASIGTVLLIAFFAVLLACN